MECIKNLGTHVFEEVLSKALHDETAEISAIKTVPPLQKGVNFLSDLFKISIHYRVRTGKRTSNGWVVVVVKTEPLHGVGALEIVREQNLFGTELRVLSNVLPRIEKLVGQEIGPRLWYSFENPKLLIMEDLTQKGFVMKNRQKGLSFDHCLLALEQMAKLHAGSVALFEQDPTIVTSFKGGIVSSNCPAYFRRFIEISVRNIGEQVTQWTDEKCIRAGKKLIALAKTISKRCMEAYSYDSIEFCVLNHGDCWVNNMMFKENERGQASDIRFVDYQMAVYTSPAIDLFYFLYTCPEISIKCTNDDFFLQSYLLFLTLNMTKIGCKTKPPTLAQLKQALQKRRVYTVFAGIVLCLRMIMDGEDTESFDTIRDLDGETRIDVFKNPYVRQMAEKMLPIMDERGYLD